jgi:alpha-mannosidase
MRIGIVIALVCVSSVSVADEPRAAYFADGYHGGVYGHYPPGYTAFLVEQLKANPSWNINLEIVIGRARRSEAPRLL